MPADGRSKMPASPALWLISSTKLREAIADSRHTSNAGTGCGSFGMLSPHTIWIGILVRRSNSCADTVSIEGADDPSDKGGSVGTSARGKHDTNGSYATIALTFALLIAARHPISPPCE